MDNTVTSLPTVHFATLETCAEASGIVVAIDVVRAFTTAAYAFAAGAERILPVGTVEQALVLRRRIPEALLMGEAYGLPPEGFDFGNSPVALAGKDLRGLTLIQRTGAGTQGLVRSLQAKYLLASSFVCAEATVRTLRMLLDGNRPPETVTLVSTSADDEDQTCAEYLAGRLRSESIDVEALLRRARQAAEDDAASMLQTGHFNQAQYESYLLDMELCLELDCFDFAMRAERENGLLVMRRQAM